jgi:hypothetical protein
MANPTTNYSFAMPTNTDLVKDLPADFEIFGQAVDTQMKTNADAAIAKTIVDAKGDLIVGTAADTVARLAVGGTNGHVLQVDSSTASGLKWDTVAAGGMTLISTTTISNAEVLLSSIPGTYKDLMLVIRDPLPTINNNAFRLRFNDDSTSNRHTDSVNPDATMSFTQTSFRLGDDLNSTNADGLMVVTFPDYANTVTWKMAYVRSNTYHQDGTSIYNIIRTGMYNQTGAVSSLRIFTNSGTPKSGTILLYGVS